MALTRQELVLQFMTALAANENFKASRDDVDRIYAMACAMADKYLENS